MKKPWRYHGECCASGGPAAKTLGACGPLGFGLRTFLGTTFTMIPPRLFQIMSHCDSSVTHHVNPKIAISEGSKKITFTKIQMAPLKIFLSDLVKKLLNLFVFLSLAWQISSNWSFQRNVGFNLERAPTSKHCYMLERRRQSCVYYRKPDFYLN